MTGSTNMKHVQVLRDIRDDFIEEDSVDAADIAALDAAIAVMSAQQPAAEAQPVGEAGSLPGSNGGFTTAVFKASDVPVGTKLYTASPSAPVGVPVDAVLEYLDARACYEAATRPPNSHAKAPVLKHDNPDALRLREARIALDNAIVLAYHPDDPVAADNAKAADQACLAMIALDFYWNGETWVLPEKAEAKPVANGVIQRHVVTKFSDGSTRVEDILTSPNSLGTMENVEAALQKWLDWCGKYDEEPEARSGARIAIEALAKQQLEVPTWIDSNWAEGHTHPHEKSSGCHCVQCRPLERPCSCDGCRALRAQELLAPEASDPSSGIKLTVRDGNWEGTFDEWQKRRPRRTARR